VSAEDYIRGLADEDLKRELTRRNNEALAAAREAAQAAAMARWEKRDSARRKFCQGIGITVHQFDAVEEYLEDEEYH
jgi:hypothetical protein